MLRQTSNYKVGISYKLGIEGRGILPVVILEKGLKKLKLKLPEGDEIWYTTDLLSPYKNTDGKKPESENKPQVDKVVKKEPAQKSTVNIDTLELDKLAKSNDFKDHRIAYYGTRVGLRKILEDNGYNVTSSTSMTQMLGIVKDNLNPKDGLE